jgi:antirestriction protein ArdC
MKIEWLRMPADVADVVARAATAYLAVQPHIERREREAQEIPTWLHARGDAEWEIRSAASAADSAIARFRATLEARKRNVPWATIDRLTADAEALEKLAAGLAPTAKVVSIGAACAGG